VLTGSMRAAQEAKERATTLLRHQEIERRQRELDARRAALEAQIAALRAEFNTVERESEIIRSQDEAREKLIMEDRAAAGVRRGAEIAPITRKGKGK
jgi:circadian clock protein KaiC